MTRWTMAAAALCAFAACAGDDDAGTGAGAPALSVTAQEIASGARELTVARVVAPAAGWLAILEADGDAPGAPLGVTAVPRGPTEPVVVALDRTPETGELLYAALYGDAGQLGSFEPGVDPVVTDLDGAPLVVAFAVTVVIPPPRPSLTVADPALPPWPWDALVIAEATVDADAGWLVVRTDAAGAPGQALGHARLLRGPNVAVLVALSRPLTDGEVLWATLHADASPADANAPDLDAPVTDAAGAPIRARFTVSAPRLAPRLVVSPQFATAPDEIYAALVETTGPAWVVVYEDAAGAPGAPLGRTRRVHGRHTAVRVDLARACVDGERLWAELRADAAPLNTFDPTLDAVTVAAAPFYVYRDVAPALSAADQLALPADAVVIATVAAPAAAWLAVRDADDQLLGVVAVPKGESAAVVVPLGRAITATEAPGEPLTATLHLDLGVPASFEPDGPDLALAEVDFAVTVSPPPTP